ncbi:hypothetical protein [Aliiruegeria lutimaris]|uniref:Uncharacterized protein n=1 Tax=Aliiruegeria lutimaris TaxID=571298 RepID=A0A1G9LAE3_9RHOB|nr:hypothetical protein [Aliiruegeria lutimaris]SDL58949.1 hypothetical protein SAMN04488026_10964 [Aliiruegeria lutimaris]
MTPYKHYLRAADILSKLYGEEFGGKKNGRYRVSEKLMRLLLQRRRLYDSDISAVTRALIERGFVLIDMDSFYVVMSANSFVNYRRVGDANIQNALSRDAN